MIVKEFFIPQSPQGLRVYGRNTSGLWNRNSCTFAGTDAGELVQNEGTMSSRMISKQVFVGALLGVSAVCAFGFQGGSPWVRLLDAFSPNAQAGHISVNGTVGANGVELQDNERGDGFLKFPGEDPIYNRSDLTGPQGDQGTQGIQGVQGIQGPQGIQGTPGTSGPGRLLMVRLNQGGADWIDDTDVATVELTLSESALVLVNAELSVEGRGLTHAVGDVAIHLQGTGIDFDVVNYPVYHFAIVPDNTKSQRNIATSRWLCLSPGTYTFTCHITGSADSFNMLTLPRLTVTAYATP